ncbi:MAG TPA: HAD-IIIA family hydrolase [Actinomycetota bacterium]|nr:HAD-IIIA family hydrolase [Actinomycetota bacterium]
MSRPSFDIVVPTVGRPSLTALLRTLEDSTGPKPGRIFIVNDNPAGPPLDGLLPEGPLSERIEVLAGEGRGPAAARNAGWTASAAEWVEFLDDDVLVPADWLTLLVRDLEVGDTIGAVQGRIRVPRPEGRKPTDWERNTMGLESARFATADMAYRRRVLEQVGGFDERFPRAYREDADLALRTLNAGYAITTGSRHVVHPVRPADRWVSLRAQKGNADDPLMDALHGKDWRRRAGAPRGGRRRHVAVTALGGTAVASRALGLRRTAGISGALWAALTADFARRRIAPGPRTPEEIRTMILTSIAIPPLATWYWFAGSRRATQLLRPAPPPPPRAVFVDRDGTLIRDVPYNGNPDLVEPMPGAGRALRRLREAAIPTAVISNQSGVGRGLLSLDQVSAVNERVERELGPLGPWFICPHGPDEACACRKPSPGLLLEAARTLNVPASECAFIGDIGSDVEAARAAGVRPILVPTPVTRPEEIASAEEVAPDLEAAVDLLLSGRTGGAPRRWRRP